LLAVLIAVIPLAVLPLHRADADRHADRSLRDLTLESYGRALPGSLILTDDTNTYFALLYLQAREGRLRDRDAVLTYLAPLPWYLPQLAPRIPEAADAELAVEVERRYRASARLRGAALGRQRAADQQAVAATLARSALASRSAYLYEHEFEEPQGGWAGLLVRDRGLLTELSLPGAAPAVHAAADTVALDFRRAAHYATDRVVLAGERAVAKRYATAANREGIRRVGLHDLAGAERAFSGRRCTTIRTTRRPG
jgi:hypothetical protein